MISISICLMIGWIAAGAEAERPGVAARIVEGRVAGVDGKPVEGASILFGPAGVGFRFVEGAGATTDAQGRYRADLSGFAWSKDAVRTMALAPGFDAVDRVVATGDGAAMSDFALEPRPWKQTRLRLEDTSGRPVAGVELTINLSGVTWAREVSDAEGRCLISMAPELLLSVSARPDGARPIETSLEMLADGPDEIKVPVLPPYRGRVVDPQGRPVADVAIGRWLSFGDDGEGDVSGFLGTTVPVITDREGRFELAATLLVGRLATRMAPPKSEFLAAADARFERVGYQVLDPARADEPVEVTLRPTRRVRIPIGPGSARPNPGAILSTSLRIAPRPDVPDWRWYFLFRDRAWKEQPAGPARRDVIEENLPEGTYELEAELVSDEAFTERLGSATLELSVPAGEGPLDLPPVELGPVVARTSPGEPAPEIDATELDSGRPLRLADLRGKVVVLDFWGYWCGPCVWQLPKLADLHRQYEGRPLAIIAVHDQSVQSREDYDRRIAFTRRRVWGGRDLPFQVLLDRPLQHRSDVFTSEGDGVTINRYGITGFPTLLVIDHEGRLVERVSLANRDRLPQLVRQLVEKAEAR